MIDTLRFVLSPIIWCMLQVLRLLVATLGSYGVAIIGLSLVMAVLTYPLNRIGARYERGIRKKIIAMQPAIAEARRTLKGEARFRAIERIYADHRFHPIMSTLTATGFLISVPLLISSMLLLLDYPPLQGRPFAFVRDLSLPDGLLAVSTFKVNLLPVAMSGIAMLDAWLKPDMDRSTRNRFYVISIVLLALTYNLPAGVILYWMSSNVWALGLTLIQRGRSG